MKVKLHTNSIHNRTNLIFAILLCAYICKDSLVNYVYVIINKATGSEFLGAVSVSVLLLFIVLMAYRKSDWACVKYKDLLVPAFILFSIIVTCLLYPENIAYILSNFRENIAWCIPAFFVGLCAVRFDDEMFLTLVYVSRICIIIGLFYAFFRLSSGEMRNDEMGLAYGLLLNVFLVTGNALYSGLKSKIDVLFSFIGLSCILLLGTRGPLVLFGCYIIVAMWICSKMSVQKKVFCSSLIIVIVVVFYNSTLYLASLRAIRDVISRTSFSTRVIDSLINQNVLSYTSGRDIIYDELIRLLSIHPYRGYGLFGEWQYINWNAHNLYLEVVFEYGYPVGIMLILWYIYTVFRGVLSEKKIANKLFLWGLILFVLGQGLFGYSHMRPHLFLLLGFSLKTRRQIHEKFTHC